MIPNISKLKIEEVRRQHVRSIFELLKDNDNWQKIGMKYLPSYKNHVIYWNSYFKHERNTEFVAMLEGRVVGLLGIHIDNDIKSSYIWLFIHSSYLRVGIGTKMLSFIEEYLFPKNTPNIYTSVEDNNLPSLNFFKSCNFEIVDYLPLQFHRHVGTQKIFLVKKLRMTFKIVIKFEYESSPGYIMSNQSTSFIFVGNSNNEPARLAYELTKNFDSEIFLILFQTGRLNDPQSLPFYDQLKCKCTIIDKRFDSFSFFKLLSLIITLFRIVKEGNVVVSNSFGPSLIFKKRIKHVFFSTGTDVTSFSNLKWPTAKPLTKSSNISFASKYLTQIAKKFLVLNQRRNIRKACLVIAPSETRDPLYESIALKIFPKQARVCTLQYSNIRNFITKSPSSESNNYIKILIGCRLDDGSEYASNDKSNFNDKNPEAILEALFDFYPPVYTYIYFIRKGSWVQKFENALINLPQKIKLIGLDEMDYKEFVILMDSVDIVIDSIGPSIPGRVSFDALALGKYLIVNDFPNTISSKFHSHIFRACNAPSLLNQLNILCKADIFGHRANCDHDLSYQSIYEESELFQIIQEFSRMR